MGRYAPHCGTGAVTLLPPPGREPVECLLDPQKWLDHGRFLTLRLDLTAPDAAILEEVRNHLRHFRTLAGITPRTKPRKRAHDPLEVWDEVASRLGKAEWTEEEARQVLKAMAQELADRDCEENPDGLKDPHEYEKQLLEAYRYAHQRIMSFG